MGNTNDNLDALGNLRLPIIGLFAIIAITITVMWAVIQYAPWSLKIDVTSTQAQQVLINQSILQQLKDLHDQALILQEGQQESNDDIIQMEQYLIDKPSTPFQPSFGSRNNRNKGKNGYNSNQP